LASINGYSEIAKTLIAKGANINMKDNDNMTPMDYAIYYGNQSTIAVLKDNGARLAKAETFNNLLSEKLGDAEAVVYYLNYSAWAVKTSNHLLIIDFFPQQKDPDESGVLNGRINPAELAGMNVTVVASHQHGDHYNEVIWEWEKSIPNIQYILGFTAPQHAANRIYIEPHTSQEVNGINVTPVTSNDAGEGFMIEVDGITLVHPGDLASSTRDISADYRAEIDFLTGLNKPIDFLFLPVTGCSFPDVEAVKLGDLYAISKLNPRVVFPMHGDAASFIEFKGRVMEQDKNQQVEVAINRGDRFFFKNEKIQKVEL
jgi:L-ascorbate metabolism protein UlaG (beta-lactamase superfamily)